MPRFRLCEQVIIEIIQQVPAVNGLECNAHDTALGLQQDMPCLYATECSVPRLLPGIRCVRYGGLPAGEALEIAVMNERALDSR